MFERIARLFRRTPPPADPAVRERVTDLFRFRYGCFKELLASNTELLNIIADMEEKLAGREVFGMAYVRSRATRAVFHALRMVQNLNSLSGGRHQALFKAVETVNLGIKAVLESGLSERETDPVVPLSRITREMVDMVGGKAANLGEVRNRAGLPVPEGFAVTASAYRAFLSENDLRDEVFRLKTEIDPEVPETIAEVSEAIQRLFMSARVPPAIAEAIEAACARMAEGRPGGAPPLRVAVRSSALGEDSELSYAGQYVSVLNVPPEGIVQAWVHVLASLYTARAIAYRLGKGIRDEDIAMSAAVIEMVAAEKSGVLYSRSPVDPADESVIVTAVWGLGTYAVEGVVTPDRLALSRSETPVILSREIAQKTVLCAPRPEGGVMELPVPPGECAAPVLSDGEAVTLARHALSLEAHYGCPQDVEWAADASGRLLILQARPLRVRSKAVSRAAAPLPYPVLVSDAATACPGVGFGGAFHAETPEDLSAFPDNGVLFVRQSSPGYVLVMRKASAIVADAGSLTGHMASLSREFDVPCIMGAPGAYEAVPLGVPVTVDATSGRVYAGWVEELLRARPPEPPPCMAGTPVHEALRRIADLVIPLRLLNPRDPGFRAESCATLHDIMRFAHETSYGEMFQLSDLASDHGAGAVKLEAAVPLDLHVIDLGGGLAEGAVKRGSASVEMLTSVPLKALLRGMLHEDLATPQPRPIHLGGFLSVMSQQMLAPPTAHERFGDRSYAIVSDTYLNFSSRVGYHYSILDCYCGKTVSKNYIHFSFKGGAADDVRKNRRVRSIALILKDLGFAVEAKGDRVDARLRKVERPLVEACLDALGRLLQFTRQMDMLMDSEDSVRVVAGRFLAGDYGFETAKEKANRD